MWPSLHLHQDPLCRPCPKCQTQVPWHRHNHVISEIPAKGAIAMKVVGMGHGCGDKRNKVRGPLGKQLSPADPPALYCPLTEPTVFAPEAHRAITAEAAPAL